MQECETGTENSIVKRVTVRSGGAGHAHSGIIKAGSVVSKPNSSSGQLNSPKRGDGKIVRLGR